MIFDMENWLWKSEFCDLHGQIHNGRWSVKNLLTSESAYFYSINPEFDAKVAGNS